MNQTLWETIQQNIYTNIKWFNNNALNQYHLTHDQQYLKKNLKIKIIAFILCNKKGFCFIHFFFRPTFVHFRISVAYSLVLYIRFLLPQSYCCLIQISVLLRLFIFLLQVYLSSSFKRNENNEKHRHQIDCVVQLNKKFSIFILIFTLV